MSLETVSACDHSILLAQIALLERENAELKADIRSLKHENDDLKAVLDTLPGSITEHTESSQMAMLSMTKKIASTTLVHSSANVPNQGPAPRPSRTRGRNPPAPPMDPSYAYVEELEITKGNLVEAQHSLGERLINIDTDSRIRSVLDLLEDKSDSSSTEVKAQLRTLVQAKRVYEARFYEWAVEANRRRITYYLSDMARISPDVYNAKAEEVMEAIIESKLAVCETTRIAQDAESVFKNVLEVLSTIASCPDELKDGVEDLATAFAGVLLEEEYP